jgi:hypothetical protein
MYTLKEAAKAIEAIKDGEFDNKTLQELGVLSFTFTKNVELILNNINPVEFLDSRDNVMKIAQINYRAFNTDALQYLRKNASFTDTDKTLNEFMVSTGRMEDAVAHFERYKDKKVFNHLTYLIKQYSDCTYFHITFI